MTWRKRIIYISLHYFSHFIWTKLNCNYEGLSYYLSVLIAMSLKWSKIGNDPEKCSLLKVIKYMKFKLHYNIFFLAVIIACLNKPNSNFSIIYPQSDSPKQRAKLVKYEHECSWAKIILILKKGNNVDIFSLIFKLTFWYCWYI